MKRYLWGQVTIGPKKDHENWWVKVIEYMGAIATSSNIQRLLKHVRDASGRSTFVGETRSSRKCGHFHVTNQELDCRVDHFK